MHVPLCALQEEASEATSCSCPIVKVDSKRGERFVFGMCGTCRSVVMGASSIEPGRRAFMHVATVFFRSLSPSGMAVYHPRCRSSGTTLDFGIGKHNLFLATFFTYCSCPIVKVDSKRGERFVFGMCGTCRSVVMGASSIEPGRRAFMHVATVFFRSLSPSGMAVYHPRCRSSGTTLDFGIGKFYDAYPPWKPHE